MRNLLLLCSLIPFLAAAQPHIFSGEIRVPEGNPVANGVIVFPLTKDTLQPDSAGIFTIDISQKRNQLFYGDWLGWKSKIYRFTTGFCADSLYVMTVWDTAWYAPYRKKGQCPVSNHRNGIIPIVYSLPYPALIKKAQAGKVQLGGCVETFASGRWYCKLHDFYF